MRSIEVSIITITYNEKEVIGRFLDAIEEILKKSGLNGEIIVVDDNSPDRTGDVVLGYIKKFNNIRLVTRSCKMGVGSAVYAGIEASRGDIIITMDADLSHPPSSLLDMIKEARKDNLVSGSRRMQKDAFNTEYHRKIAALILNAWAGLFLFSKVKDYSIGYIAVKRSILEYILEKGGGIGINPFDKAHYGIPLFAMAYHLQIKSIEVLTPYNYRGAGKTKIRILYGIKLLLDNLIYIPKLFIILKARGKGIKGLSFERTNTPMD